MSVVDLFKPAVKGFFQIMRPDYIYFLSAMQPLPGLLQSSDDTFINEAIPVEAKHTVFEITPESDLHNFSHAFQETAKTALDIGWPNTFGGLQNRVTAIIFQIPGGEESFAFVTTPADQVMNALEHAKAILGDYDMRHGTGRGTSPRPASPQTAPLI